MMRHLEHAPLPAFPDTPYNRDWTRRLADLLAATHRILAPRSQHLVLRGGTAARIGWDLSRPSYDIDADLVGPFDPWTTLQDAGATVALQVLAHPDRRRQLKGTLILNDDRLGSTTIQVDIRRLREPNALALIHSGALAHTRTGVFMYRPHTLAQQKIDMATQPGRRRRARDRYDIAWWLHTHVEHVPSDARILLDQTLHRDPELRRLWDANHQLDPLMRSLNTDSVHDALTHALNCDPVVLQHRHPDGKLAVELHASDGARLLWERHPRDRQPALLADLHTDAELASYMTRFWLWSPDDVSKQLQALTTQRTQARTRTLNPR